MLLTISTTYSPATDLGYLLHKNPARIQSADLSFGKAHVFYPQATAERCTVALQVDIDPISLVRSRRGASGDRGQLQQYVNDRPYTANSFLSVALAEVFSTAMGGRSKERQELADRPTPLTANLPVVAVQGGVDLLQRLFAPLGFAPVGRAGISALGAEEVALAQASKRILGLGELLQKASHRLESLERYRREYRQYCWPVQSLDDVKLAPFHLLASENAVHTDKRHVWHMEMLGRLCQGDERLLLATPFQIVDVNDTESCAAATLWWNTMTAAGREGMVVKPLDFVVRGRRGIAQPAIKCRGPEYLRIIYGPEYLLPENLSRLRSRAVGAKRSLASREFALGLEALERFVSREPLRRTHECVFGVLAMESEPVDPRL